MEKLTGLHFVNVDLINKEIEESQAILDRLAIAKSRIDFVKSIKLTEQVRVLKTILANCKSVKKTILKENNY